MAREKIKNSHGRGGKNPNGIPDFNSMSKSQITTYLKNMSPTQLDAMQKVIAREETGVRQPRQTSSKVIHIIRGGNIVTKKFQDGVNNTLNNAA
ncbi:MAG: hypothetical protein N4A38_01775 [Candidatus Gracilibacteria bacterium]|nr:hypothetical protein [Candidatus Gracilibacteria bacterium]